MNVVAGRRWAPSSADFGKFVLDTYFKGPGYTEKYIYGWISPLNGATGFHLQVANGVALVNLEGGCSSQGSTFTIAQPIMANLKQLPNIQFVKIFDPAGNTQFPDGEGDSIPGCLEP